MHTPKPRGALSAELFAQLQGERPVAGLGEPESADDAQIALWTLYELHYRGLEDVDEAREWDPSVLAVRRDLEEPFEQELRSRFTPPHGDDPVTLLRELIEGHEGPSLSAHLQRHADREQSLEVLRHRSIFHLKESDPQTWVVPRLAAAPKAALMELQYDEYGGGHPDRLHAHLFAEALDGAGLSSAYGDYIDDAPTEILSMNNAMSLFGLHRRLRGAALGYLAAFEATSSVPSRRIARGLRRLDFDERTAAYYDEHVEADAVHEQLALHAICGAFLAGEPRYRDDVLLGAFTCLDLEARYAARMLRMWEVAS